MIVFYFIIGVIAGIIGANMAKGRGQNPALWFIVCFLFPIAVLGLLFIEKNKIVNDDRKMSENFVNDTYKFELKRTDHITFQSIKEQAMSYYNDKGFTNIKIDNDGTFLVKTEDGKSYYEIQNNYRDYILFSVYNNEKPSFIDSIIEQEKSIQKEQDKKENLKQNTKKVIELGNMLEKGLITQEEFEMMKNELV